MRLKKIKLSPDISQAPYAQAEVKFDPASASAAFVISTPSQDREGDVLIPNGCLAYLKTYQANPIVLYDHGVFPLPIALSEEPDTKKCTVQVLDNLVMARAYFHQRTLESSQVCSLVEAKVLRGASVGFRGITAEPVDPRNPKGGKIFKEWEMVEWSIVPIPANQDALRMALSAKWDGKPLAAPIRKSMKALLIEPKVTLVAASSPKSKPVQSSKPQKESKAMATDLESVNDEAQEMREEHKEDHEADQQLPASALAAKALYKAYKSMEEEQGKIRPLSEHEKMNKALDKCYGKMKSAVGECMKAASEHHPDHFPAEEMKEFVEPAEEEKAEDKIDGHEDQEEIESEDMTHEPGKQDEVKAEDQVEEEDEEDKEKSLKLRQEKSWQKEVNPHVSAMADTADLLSEMSTSVNIPASYKRQAKGVLPGIQAAKGWLAGKTISAVIEKSQTPEPPSDEIPASVLKELVEKADRIGKTIDNNASRFQKVTGRKV